MKIVKRWLAERAEVRADAALAERLARLADDPVRSLRDEVEEWAAEGRDRLALAGADETLAFRDLYAEANRWSRWAIVVGLAPREPAALLMPPSPRRFAALIGLSAVGVIATIFDPALAPTALSAALDAVRPAQIVVDATLLPTFEAAAAHLALAGSVWIHGAHPMAYRRVDEALAGLSAVRLAGRDRRPLAAADPCVAIVRADAAGRTRADHLDQGRVVMLAVELAGLLDVRRDDRLAVVEAGPTLESLLVPFAALARGAPCRFPGASPASLGEPTVLHLAGPLPIERPAATRLVLVEADAATRDPDLRPWALRCEGRAVRFEIGDRSVVLPTRATEIRS
ncbi:MAG: AMP-binding protein [Hyphomicrobiales bacterium]|nr:AMP-binding protein [Hyphomicrobiales bacterium]